MAEHQLLEKSVDELPEVSQKKEDQKGATRSRRSPVQAQLVTQLAAAGAALAADHLVQLQADSPQLYQLAMAGLQGVMGNQHVNQLHEEVQRRIKNSCFHVAIQ